MRRFSTIALAATILAMLAAATANAGERLYWANNDGNLINWIDLAIGSGGNLDTTGSTAPAAPRGVAVDAASSRVYWVDNNGLHYASADSSGGGHDVPAAGATFAAPSGLDLDLATGRAFWANTGSNTIGWASLSGAGGGSLDLSGSAAGTSYQGVAVDNSSGRIYFTSTTGVNLARLDGGGSAAFGGASGTDGRDVAVDHAHGLLYWLDGDTIKFNDLGQTGGSTPVSIAPVGYADQSFGIAVDRAAGRLIFVSMIDYSAPLRAVTLATPTGNGQYISAAGAGVHHSYYPYLLASPVSLGGPTVSGSSVPAKLTCNSGGWQVASNGSHASPAPRDVAISWTFNGAPLAGATGKTLAASVPGSYSCTETASNLAGATTATSSAAGLRPSSSFKLGRISYSKRKGTATFKLTPAYKTGRLKISGAGVSASQKSKSGVITATVKAKGSSKKTLARRGKVTLKAKLTWTPAGGPAKSQVKTLKLVKR
ncbi:MAG: hypothetical protein QM648_05890 [Solirubrobacterales bacterium]